MTLSIWRRSSISGLKSRASRLWGSYMSIIRHSFFASSHSPFLIQCRNSPMSSKGAFTASIYGSPSQLSSLSELRSARSCFGITFFFFLGFILAFHDKKAVSLSLQIKISEFSNVFEFHLLSF